MCTVEACLLNFAGDLGGQSMMLDLIERLQPEAKGDPIEALIENAKGCAVAMGAN